MEDSLRSTSSRHPAAGFAGPIDLPIPEWAKKTSTAQRTRMMATMSAEAAAEADELAATAGSSGGAGDRNRIDHRNVPVRWQDKRALARTARRRKDPRFQRQRVRKLKPGSASGGAGAGAGAGAGGDSHSPSRSRSRSNSRAEAEAKEKEFGGTMTRGGVLMIPETPADEGASKQASPPAPAATSVQLLLQLMGSDALSPEELSELSPPTAAPDDEEFLRLDQSKLPLELFDSSDYERATPQQWLESGSGAMSPYFTPKGWTWETCDVISFHDESQRFLVRFHCSGKQKYVKRINLLFDKEDRALFCERLRFCLAFRERTKAAIRFQHFVEQQPEDSSSPMADSWLSGIHRLATSFVAGVQQRRERAAAAAKATAAAAAATAGSSEAKTSSDDLYEGDREPYEPDPATVSALFGEVVDEYDASMRIAILYHSMKTDGTLSARYQKLRLPPVPGRPPIPRFAKVAVPAHAFEDNRINIATSMRFASANVIKVFQWASNLWHSSFAHQVFMDVGLEDLTLPCSLHSFKHAQRKHGKSIAQRLASEWRRGISDCLVDNVQNLYNFFESDPATHALSPLHSLIKTLQLVMAHQLRDITKRSATSWVAFLDRYTPPAIEERLRQEAAIEASAAMERVAAQRRQAAARRAAAAEEAAKRPKDKDKAAAAAAAAAEEAALLEPQEAAPGPAQLALQAAIAANVWATPLFNVELVVLHGVVRFSPSVEEIEKVMLSALTTMQSSVRGCVEIEGEVMSLLPISASPLLNVGTNDPLCSDVDEVMAESRRTIKRLLARDMAGPRSLAARYEQFVHVLELSTQGYVDSFVAGEPGLEAYHTAIEGFHSMALQVERTSFDQEQFGLVRVQCAHIKAQLRDKARRLANALMSTLVALCVEQSQGINARYQEIMERIQVKPANEAELVQLKDYIKESAATIEGLQAEVDAIHARLDMMEPYGHAIAPEHFVAAWSTKEWPNRVADATDESLAALEVNKQRMMDKLERQKVVFERDLERYMEEVAAFKQHSDPAALVKVVDAANTLDNKLREAQDKAADFNKREKVFGYQPTEYTKLAEMMEDFAPFYKLWTTMSDFHTKKQSWLTGSFLELQADEIERDVTDWWTSSYRLMRNLEDTAPGPAEVAGLLRTQTDSFKRFVPLIQALASPALKERHWSTLSERVGKDISPDDELTLQQLLDEGIMEHMATVEEVCVVAEKEFGLEKALDSMIHEWDDIDFEVVAYKETGTYVIRTTEDVSTLLDDQIVKVQTMMGSPFIKPILGRAKKWEKRLLVCQSLLDEWMACQRTWLYLEPIFSSEDIMRQMPVEGRRFASVDALWRKTMADTNDEPRVMEQAGKENILDKFRNANKMLDQIQKGLNDYLEIKRLAFPRFYFLSNDELLEILSQTKDPRAVQPFLSKCFEGMNAVGFRGEATGNAQDVLITHMVSGEGERVELADKVDPEKGSNKGNVENWLLQLQSSMRITVKEVAKAAMAAYPSSVREAWVLSWPGQIVLNVSQLYWTREAEEAMRTSGNEGLHSYLEVLNGQLAAIVERVRSKLTKLERVTLGALCVVDVHARDVVEHCAKAGVEDPIEFAWMSQLRYYWEEQADDYNRYGTDPMNLLVRIVNATQMYGYEYLGNSSRLVITPLTDRCYRTLCGAVVLMYGGAPAGPAGTGKTETVKDLSKACSIQCVVFNCSDGLDYLAMAKFFKGLAASGAWSCFDEFNRIELEVLSVIAQQILTIQKAKRGRLLKFVFEGTTLGLNPDANVFITMNPGYAGRTELPDNLQALFRPCAMMVPDYALIAEIKLYSFGFSDARNMARKLVQVLRLSSEQLSTQKHYDYGMRAVFSILVRAGKLRQSLGDKWTEDLLVLSSINDVNLPKFTTNDLPLFKGITQDLFPGVTLPMPDYDTLLRSIYSVCLDRNLQPKDEFVRSVIQLFETVAVRHGLMVVGRTMAGKTQVIHTLQEAMSRLSDGGASEEFFKTIVHTINPKSITQGQLYGNFDDNTHEWEDGVLAVQFRTYAKDASAKRHWVVFDGPVDAVWIENMNTVLDDNKKLCLNSGEIIKMSARMTMMFEPEDLEVASPATVSRVGMVFMEPKRMGWRPQMQTYLATIPETLQPHAALIEGLFEWLVPPLLFFTRTAVTTLCPVTDVELVASLVNVFQSLCAEPFGPKGVGAPKPADTPKALEAMFVMALTWSIGVVSPPDGRARFDAYLRELLAGDALSSDQFAQFMLKNPLYDAHFTEGGHALREAEGDERSRDPYYDEEGQLALWSDSKGDDGGDDGGGDGGDGPGVAEGEMMRLLSDTNRRHLTPLKEGTVRKAACSLPASEDGLLHDFCIQVTKGGWSHWMKGVGAYTIPQDAPFTSILVPTIDTIRNEWVLDLLMTNHKHVMCVGDTGTGKSVSTVDKLLNKMDAEKFVPAAFLAFSAQTSANMTQDIIDAKMNRRRKGMYGPVPGYHMVIFVDDLNMPAKETYGAQPPIELLRQWMDHGGWYDRSDKELAFMRLVDIQFVVAMGPPGGGRTRITQRYVRHMNIIGCVPFDSDSLKRVFSSITSWFMASYPSKLRALGSPLVDATIDLYNTIARELLPTPSKSHYTFNLRDLSKVFQGMATAGAETIEAPEDVMRLWGHECMRVFHDRLIDEPDREWFHTTVAASVKQFFKKDWLRDVRGARDVLLYGNFANPRAKKPVYGEMTDHEALQGVMNQYLEDYNQTNPKTMALVLFMNAIEHVARISRVINQPFGNALLVGVGGSGRKSLTTLAVSIAEFKLFEVEISKGYGMTEWREDLKRVLRLAGEEGHSTVFLFSDTQIVNESFVEDINNILNNGEVPNLFLPDERAEILANCSEAAAKEGRQLMGPSEQYSYFVTRSRNNMHMCLCFSPIGDAFRTRLRMFPSLVNCCTIDWFTAWPEQALRSVANHFLDDKVDLAPDIKAGVIDVCVDMQERVSGMTTRYLDELRRYYYVTPTSYLELINTFKLLIGDKRTDVLTKKQRYENGLDKLSSTAEQVAGMQKELTDLQPKLVVATEETDKMLAKIKVMTVEANKKQEVVAAEEKTCMAQAADAQAQKDECEAMLAEAIPALNSAVKALATLKKSDITEVKAMKKPPDGVKVTMEAVCIMLSVAPKKVPNPAGRGPKVNDYWEPAQKHVLGDSKFLDKLKKYDKDNIDPDIMEKIRPFCERDDFMPDVVAKASKAAWGICKWVHAMVIYDRVAKVVAPKKAALEVAKGDLAAAQAALAVKQAELAEVQERLAKLQEELKFNMDKKDELERKVVDCSNRLDRAERLIGGLGGERTRWTQFAAELQLQYDNIVGDILLSAGLIAYLGAFTSSYRASCLQQWAKMLRSKDITCADSFSLAATLGEPVMVRAWTIAKLPNDSFSIDNAIMLYKSKRWPLMIDPQGQANRWVRNTEAENNLKVCKQSQATFVRTIENAIQFGAPVLLENVPETIDPILESVLLRQVVKAGGVNSIRLGDALVEYDEAFRLYITTKLSNPHYPPETCVKVNLLNFMATEEGLQDQMLGIVVQKELPELEEQREKLIMEDAENKRQLKEIEDKILALLAASKGNILDDEVLINTLSKSKETGNAIQVQVEAAAKTQIKISEARMGYKPVAMRASSLFFCIADLASVDPMYQYSLEWYITMFLIAVDKAAKSADLEERLEALNATFTFVLYQNVCRSLFEKDKLLFSFLLCTKILVADGTIRAEELRFLLQGNLSMDLERPNPTQDADIQWLTDKNWADVLGLAQLPRFSKFDRAFESNLAAWRAVYDSDGGEGIAEAAAPTELDLFQQMCVLRCVRPDKVVPRVRRYIAAQLGTEFIEPPPFDLQACFDDSKCTTPLIFVLSAGADPMTELLKLADKLGYAKKLFGVSLGQGQGPIAENAIAEAVDKGTWVCLQNCHLAASWMPTLERICEEITPERTHPDFRLWLTAMPSKDFPVYVLQNGVKLTLEPPKGMRANLTGSYRTMGADFLEGCRRPAAFKKLVFGLCFFHAIVRERRKFGPLGWNIPYQFSEPDLRISLDQLRIFLDEDTVELPFETLNYTVGECNYGGRVTDDKDRRCLISILSDFYTPDILNDDYAFSDSGLYYAPPDGDFDSYLEYIKTLPLDENPEVFGLHENANITCAIQETNQLLDTALSLQPRSSGGGGDSWEDKLSTIAKDIGDRMPQLFDIERVEIMYPIKFEESMNTVLVQELMRFNKLIKVMKTSLAAVQKAIKGLVVMSQDLEAMGNSMVKGWVPSMWKDVSYPSLKPLGSFVTDLLARLEFLQAWIDSGSPAVYWISGFFFTQSFLTGTRQNFARKYTIPIDEVSYDFEVLTFAQSEAINAPPKDGAYVRGLFLEGANWDDDNQCLVDSRPKELYVAMPVITLIPRKNTDINYKQHVYECPTYKTSARRGMLSTTGHSTNFVIMMWLPMADDHDRKYWVKKGVALLTQLDT